MRAPIDHASDRFHLPPEKLGELCRQASHRQIADIRGQCHGRRVVAKRRRILALKGRPGVGGISDMLAFGSQSMYTA